MTQATKVPRREWLAVLLPIVFPLILLGSVAGIASSRHHGVLVAVGCLLGGAAISLVYSAVLLHEGRLFLNSRRDVDRNKRRIAGNQTIGWILGVGFVGGEAFLSGVSRLVLVSIFAGLIFGIWPGLLANFIRLRRERHWG
jgi:hypothetical protein